jgi:hypothetical protein
MICWLLHLWTKLNFMNNYGDWEHKFSSIYCYRCRRTIMSSHFAVDDTVVHKSLVARFSKAEEEIR